MRITLICEPPRDTNTPFTSGLEKYKNFAAALGRHAGTEVNIVEGYLDAAPRDGFVLLRSSGDLAATLAGYDPVLRARLTGRLVLLEVGWQGALEQLEQYEAVAAVDSLRFAEWRAGSPGAMGPYGRRELAPAISAECVPLPFLNSSRYCLFESHTHDGLPHLLADYLREYERVRGAATLNP